MYVYIYICACEKVDPLCLYIYCSTLISAIILRVLTILLFILIAIIISVIIDIIDLFTIIILSLVSFKNYLFIYLSIDYLLIRRPIRSERSSFDSL